ncbi:hypothetical protein LUZ63_000443 [Rhynchospora breviuscula]|uniref:Ubiquitin-like protease family profile domain-containing protein n=1 Tax=Rhynchospora breviuscula TaxID=2022672 RepID=A0A9Q0HW30_9POAL|nr:hypothetical protein LUZ63_000443 [Rhynchospora breviuscula]
MAKVPSETSSVGREPLLDKKYLDKLNDSERFVYEMLMLQPGDTHLFMLEHVDPWGTHTGEVKFSVSVGDILECLKREQLSISILKMYSWFWKEKLTNEFNLENVFTLDPDMVSLENIGVDKARVINYLEMSFLSVDPTTYIIFSYFQGRHWAIMVVRVSDYTVYYADSLNRRSSGIVYQIKGILNTTLRHYLNEKKIKRDNPSFRWIELLCSKQEGDFECGYFSMLYMKGIIEG